MWLGGSIYRTNTETATAAGMAEMPRNWQTVVAQVLPAALLGVVAFALALIITDPPGPGLDPDALAYMGAAESLAESGAYQIPTAKWASADSTAALAHFPPAYSTVLALPVRLGMTAPQAARLVQALAAAVTVTTLVLLVSAATTALAGILLAVALFAMTSMHEVHASVLSEPLYLTCTALVLAAMVCAPDRPLRAGIPAAVGVMTRYVGASLVGAVVLWQLAQRGPWRVRLRRAVVGTLPAIVVQGAWLLRTRAVAGTGEIRQFALYGNLRPTVTQGAATLTAWLIPDPSASTEPVAHRGALALTAGCALLVLVMIGVVRTYRTQCAAVQPPRNEFDGLHENDRIPSIESGPFRSIRWIRSCAVDPHDDAFVVRLLSAATLLTVAYLGVVVVSLLVADPNIPLDERILAPVLLLLMTIAATALTLWWRATRLDIARIAVCGALLGWWSAAATSTLGEARYALDRGSDFAGEQWRRSELLAWARTEGAGVPLYTNWPSAVYFYLQRPARELPTARDARTLAAFADTVRVRGGRILLFDVQTTEYAPRDSLVKVRGLHTIATVGDGTVLGP